MSIQKGIADFTHIIGTGLIYGGGFSLFLMAAIGTISIDLVILSAAQKERNSFLTGFVLGSLFSRGNLDPIPLLIASPITSAIAVILSFALGVPVVGVGILIGWAAAASVLAIGLGLHALAKAIEPEPEPSNALSPSFA